MDPGLFGIRQKKKYSDSIFGFQNFNIRIRLRSAEYSVFGSNTRIRIDIPALKSNLDACYKMYNQINASLLHTSQSSSDVACSLTLDEVPGDSDLYVYLNIVMAIVLFQWVSFAAMPSRILNPLSVVTVGNISGGSCHSVVGK